MRCFCFLFVLPILLIFSCVQPSVGSTTGIDKTIKEVITENNIATQNIVLHVLKSEYVLHVEHADTVLKSFPIVLGGNPIGEKLMEGDQKTPEGEFTLRDLYPHRKWTKFLWIDYPTDESRKNHNAAKANGTIPDNARIGGEVGIHGVPEGYNHIISEKQNWTLGCISLTNKDVNELFEVCQKGTKILIEP